MKVIDFQAEKQNRKGEVLDIQDSPKIMDIIEIKEISKGEESSKLESNSGFATIKTDEARRVTYKRVSSKKEVLKKDISLKDMVSQEQKRKVISLFKSFPRAIISNKKIALTIAVLIVGGLAVKGLYNSFSVSADTDESYISKFNRDVEDKYLKELEGLSASIGEGDVSDIEQVKSDASPTPTVSEKSKSYFSVAQVAATFTEDVKGKNSTYTVNVEVAIPTDKISVKVSNVVDIAYSEEDIEIVSVDIQDSFNREYLGTISVDEKTVKDIESLIEKEKELVREKVYSKSKQEFMDVINKSIKESVNL